MGLIQKFQNKSILLKFCLATTGFGIMTIKKKSCHSERMDSRKWIPGKYLNLNNSGIDENYAIVLLNRPLNLDPKLSIKLWNEASVRLVVDGGAKRWLNFKETIDSNICLKHPDLLTGDFDSISVDLRNHFESIGTIVKPTIDQSETDFTKGLLDIKETYVKEKNIGSVIVLHDISGRIDHILSQINTLFKAKEFLPNVPIYLLSKSSISWLLDIGRHEIHIPEYMVRQQMWCSYVPIGHKCNVITQGLKWDLYNKTVEFGGMVSTSNTYINDVIVIETDGNLFWSMGLEEIDSD